MPGRKIPEEQRREGILRAAFAVAAREGLAGVQARAVGGGGGGRGGAERRRAAFAVAAREGLAGVTARAVAAEAGVSSGLVFFHFGTVDALLAALLDWLLARTLVAGELP